MLARDDAIDVETLADKAFMSETTVARCLEAWNACVAALIEVGGRPTRFRGTSRVTTRATQLRKRLKPA